MFTRIRDIIGTKGRTVNRDWDPMRIKKKTIFTVVQVEAGSLIENSLDKEKSTFEKILCGF